jgi:hypothetical protein
MNIYGVLQSYSQFGKYECSIMAINRISGDILESNLIRSSDLAFNTDLLYVDVTNGRIGVKTDSPGNFALDVNGNTRIQGNQTITGDLTVQGTTTTIDSQNLTVEDNIITINENASTATDAGIMISRAGENDAVFYWDEVRNKFRVGTTTSDGSTRQDLTSVNLARLQVAEPTADDDAAHKKYVDDQIATVSSGGTVLLGTPTDSTFGDGAFLGLDTSGTMTDAIDDLNETMENIRNGTYVKSVSFVSDSTSISLGDTVTLTITTVPAADGNIRYTIDWGDGEGNTATTDSTPSHTYNTASGSPMSVTVEAFDNTATTGSSGSTASSTRTDYITVASAAPVVGFVMKDASSGGSTITTTDSGNTVYLENTTTNTVSDCTYEVDWGDGTSNSIANDSADGGASGSRLSHTYTNSASADDSSVAGTGPGDTKYRIRLTLLSHSTAAPEQIPQSADANFEVYSTHTPKIDIADSTLRGVNEEGTSGFPRTFINGTDSFPGANSAFSATQNYQWDFTDDSTQTTVVVGSGSSGDTDQTISKTFGFTQSGSGTVGSTQTYPVKLVLNTGHSTGTFESAITNIVVEPDVRANLAGAAVTTNTGSGDNSLSLYDVTDLDGTNRAIGRFTNTSQNGDDYEYDFQNDSSDVLTLQEDGSTAGTVGNTLDKNFTGISAGNIVTDFRVTGTPDTIHQNDTQTVTFVMKATPSAPANLSSKSLTLSDSAQGTNPHLCANFDDATGSADTLAAGTSLESTTARRYTSTSTIDTNTVTNFLVNNSNGTGSTVNQTVTASINGSASGARTFTTSEGGANDGTFTDLVISNHRDYDEVDSSYPQRLYLVATAKIAKGLTNYTAGLNAQRIESSAGGNTNYVHVVRDLLTGSPTTTIGTIAQSAAGNLRYISGVPYYNDGSPSLSITGTTVANFTGQAYQDASDPHEVDPGTSQESTSGNVISATSYTYADIDGSSTMLSSSIPVKNTGVGSPYTLGTLTQALTTSNVRAVQQIKARSKNANGTGSYSESSTKIQVYTDSLLTLDNEAGGITVSDSLGAGFDDDAVRISGFGSLSGDTPSLNDSSNANYYTDHAWSGAVTVAGTNEAISRFGTIKHFTTDLSSGYLPAGPDLNTGRSGAQYYNFAFRRTTMANFNITLSGKVSGMFIAAPGTAIDSASGLNGWLDCSTTYGGSGVPGSDTGNGGNGSNGCAFNSGDRVVDGTTYSSQEFTFTLGTENATNATGNNILVRIKLESGDSITALSID